MDGAYFRVHHFARQLGSPFPLLAACGVKTKRIEIGTALIDMRYENPLYMVEDAGAADVIGGRLRLGISRGGADRSHLKKNRAHLVEVRFTFCNNFAVCSFSAKI